MRTRKLVDHLDDVSPSQKKSPYGIPRLAEIIARKKDLGPHLHRISQMKQEAAKEQSRKLDHSRRDKFFHSFACSDSNDSKKDVAEMQQHPHDKQICQPVKF